MKPVVTCYTGQNDVIFSHIASLYLKEKTDVRDVTFGKGVFWKQVDTSKFKTFRISDSEEDFRRLSDEDKSFDVVVLDPPYLPTHDGDVKASIADQYRINETAPRSIAAITALYAQGMAEAARILRPGGTLIVKCQDQIESHKRHWTHIDIFNIANAIKLRPIDLFVSAQPQTPLMRQEKQHHARSNHSFFWVFERCKANW